MDSERHIKPELIIFDNDGVLVDSEVIWHEQCASYFANKGISVSIDDSIQFFYLRQENILAKIITSDDVNRIRALTENAYLVQLKAVLGIEQVLQMLVNNDYKICVASNADKPYITHTLSLTHLNSYFDEDNLFSVDIVEKRKPAPDLFLHIANLDQISGFGKLLSLLHSKVSDGAELKINGRVESEISSIPKLAFNVSTITRIS
ncbi:putative HAD-superfamily hydrolase subfamily IA, variant 3 [Legionella fallonii LLAP-10]|uniref:Putative HAD-superfamily hydrolase subfamily IA, variant 3 n=1 Tax=Legionella fallonii LLAP-10 TaxID=1212491 RepID=A0A098G2L1_9GAMM|nr:putative HAD-superfamily hydrolase subfamily IA, variant 3 [Legionella fallonii LLAP-10]